jgi:YfiH family protein
VSSPALVPAWPVASRVRAFCTLRTGGVSAAPYSSLNLATHVGDAPASVGENRRRLRSQLALPSEPLWLEQVHGIQVLDADAEGGAHTPADAAITRTAGRVLAVLVADCLPVLLATRAGDVIGVAHAGWRGLAAGVIERTVEALGAPPEQLQAWLGPAISAAQFEVGAEVRTAFVSQQPQAASCFSANARGRWQCDLAGLARQRLELLGVHSVHDSQLCTAGDPARFYSYRRDGQTGRIAALLWIAGAEENRA